MNYRTNDLRLKLLNWFVYMAVGASAPFILLYCKSLFSTGQGIPAIKIIGVLFFIQPFFGIFANPVAGVLSDKFKIKDKILFFCAFMTFIGIVFLIIPGLAVCSECSLLRKFFVVVTGIVLTGLFTGPINPLINTEVLDHLHAVKEDPGNFGRYRVYGTISWVFISCVTGLVIDLSGALIVSIYLYGAGFLLLAIISCTGIKAKIKPIQIPWHLLKKDTLFIKFLVFIFFSSFGLLSAYAYTSYFMDDLNFSFLVIGIAYGVSSIPEIPVMLTAGRIMQKIGNRKMIIYGTLLLILKILLIVVLSWFHIPVLIILPMLLHGAGYGLQLNGIVNFVDKCAHRDLKTTYMTLYTVFGLGLAKAFGNLFSSFIINILDSSWMMLLNAAIAALSLLFFIFIVKEKTEKTGR